MSPGTLELLHQADAAYARAKAEILEGAPPARVAADLHLAGATLVHAARALVRESAGGAALPHPTPNAALEAARA